MHRLAGDLSDVARLGTGRFQIYLMELDLASLVIKQADTIRQTALQHAIVYDGPGAGVISTCDPDRVAQVIANLLGNALKYTDGGTVPVF